MARPTKYCEKYHVPWVRSLARRGLTVKEIAKEMEVSRSTLNLWVREHPEFSDALNQSRSEADAMVEDSLFRRAMGTTVKETRKIVEVDKSGQPEVVKVDTWEKELPPDVAACIFWLKNRRPKSWRERPEAFMDDNRPVINITIPAEASDGR